MWTCGGIPGGGAKGGGVVGMKGVMGGKLKCCALESA
jgi:hypothetical protein